VKKPALGVVAANFWTNGISSADLITVNGKSSVITLESSNSIAVGISDPTQTNKGTITVTLNRAAAGVASVDAGVTVVQLSPKIILSVNVNGSHGKSYQAALTYSNCVLTVNAVPSGTNTRLVFPTQFGFNYQIEYKTNLTEGNWISVGAPVPGNGALQSIEVPIGGANGFYRVRLE
jgi:hyaluronate lyase